MTTFNNINTEVLAQDQHFHIPAIGGIDSMNPKNAVQPGTLMDCLNYEVTLEAGYTPTEGLLMYRGASFDAPTRFYSAEFDDSASTTKVTDLIPGITYKLWKNASTEIGKIRFLGTDLNTNSTSLIFDSLAFDLKEDWAYDVEDSEFADEGTKLFVLDSDTDTIKHYTLSAPYDIDVNTLANQLDVSADLAVDTFASSIELSSDGTKLYVLQGNAGSEDDPVQLLEYTMSTAYDLTTATLTTSSANLNYLIADRSGQLIWRMQFGDSGSKLYLGSTSSIPDRLYEYDLSTPYDLSTIAYSGNFFELREDASDRVDAFRINPTGTQITIYGDWAGSINQEGFREVTLSTAWDLSTASYVPHTESFFQYDITFASELYIDYSKGIVLIGQTGSVDGLNQFVTNPTEINFDLVSGDTAEITSFLSTTSADTYSINFEQPVSDPVLTQQSTDSWVSSASRSLAINDSGTVIITSANSTSVTLGQEQYNLSTPYDVSTSTRVHSNTNQQLIGLSLSPDGTVILGIDHEQTDRVGWYVLSTASDLSTSSALNTKSFSSIGLPAITGKGADDWMYMTVHPDGDKAYIVAYAPSTSTTTFYQCTMSTPWDPSTLSYDNVSIEPDGTTDIWPIQINDAGTQLIMADNASPGFAGNTPRIYLFGTAKDLSTLNTTPLITTPDASTSPRSGVTFVNDGSRNLVMFASSADIRSYELTFTDNTDQIIIDDSTIHEDDTSHSDYLTSYTKVATSLASSGASVTGTGPINGLFFHEDQLYAARDEAGGTYSELYTVSNTEDQLTTPAWTKVDLGSEFKFKDGQGDPITVYDKEFLEETVDLSDPVKGRLGSAVESVQTLNNINSIRGRWEADSIDNVLSDAEGDSSGAIAYVRSTVSASVDQPLKDYTQRLNITGFNIGDTISSTNVNPVGIEVDVRFAFDTNGAIIDGTEKATISHISLLGLGGTDDKSSSVPTYGPADKNTFRTVTVGGAADVWSAASLSSTNLFSSDFGVSLEFQGAVSKPSTTTSPAIRYTVPWVKVTVYFENGDSKIYFWDGAAETGSADLVNISLTDGAFHRDNAAGYMTIYNEVTTGSVNIGDEIRTATGGAGNLLGVVDSLITKNTLPSSAEMDTANAIMVTDEFNFFIDPDKEAVYGVTGASPAFQYNGTHFWYIHTPVPENIDTPRYLANHQNTLSLAFDSGSVLVSPAGQPYTFSGVLGAVEFGFSDRITGLVNLGGNALGVVCKESIHAILGTSISNFTTQIISKSSGALDYTVADIGQPTYLDFRGISNIQATQTYGDFSWGRLSQLISKDIQGKIQKTSDPAVVSSAPVLAIPVKNKNQYRIYFADGSITTMTLFGAAGDTPMFTTQDYAEGNDFKDTHFVPTAFATRITENGKEILAIGLESGDIFILDEGNPGIAVNTEIVPMNRSLTFNPFFAGAPYLNVKYSEVMMHLRSTGFTDLNMLAGVNFLKPTANEIIEITDVGTVSAPVDWEFPFDRSSGYLSNITDGFVVKIEGVSDGNPTHVIQALTYKGVGLSDKNASPKRYS